MNKKLMMSGVAFLMGITALTAQPTLIEKIEAQSGKLVIPYERWKLPNGLTILLHEDHSDPIVNVLVTYKVGSNRESIGKSGFAHFFEHMMFQGSKNVGDEQHFKMVSTAGGNMNGQTQRDQTLYYETLPSNYLEMALWLESDRMGFLLDSLTSKKFENQRDAVKNEKSQNVENQPYAMAFVEEINKTLYPPGHPYSWPVIGYVDDLNRADLTDVKNFFLRWYGPNNAILSISGDFNKEEALKLVDKYFGDLKQSPEAKKMRVPLVTIASDKYTAYKDKTYFPLNLRVYPTVPQYHRDHAALDVLGLMFSGNNSILYRNFVKTKEAVDASGGHSADELSGEFAIQIFAYPPEDFNLEKLFTDIDNKVKACLDTFGTQGITDEALSRAKGQIESFVYGSLNSVADKNSVITDWERLLGKSSTPQDELDRYMKVTKEDVSRVFNKYIKGSGAAILNTYPIIDTKKDSVKSVNPYAGRDFPDDPEYSGLTWVPQQSKFDRSKKPTEGTTRTVKVPEFYTSTLANGLKISGTNSNETPEITLVFNIEGGYLAMDPGMTSKMGLPEMTALMLNEGTKNYTTEKISGELDKLGSSVAFSVGRTANNIYVSCLKKNLDATLKLFEEKLLSPGFREEDFKLVKKQYKEQLRDERVSSDQIATKAFNYAMYGDNILGQAPTPKSMENIELADIKKYFERGFSAKSANLVIVGDISESEIMAKLKFLDNWKANDITLIPVPEQQPSTEPKFFIYNKELAPSSIIVMGCPSLKFDATGDYFKNRVANFIFGGNFNSRLNLNLREDKGYTYGINSSFNGGKYSGVFQIRSSVKRVATAKSLAEIIKEFRKYAKDGITDEELAFTKNSMLNVEALQYEHPRQKAAFLNTIARFNLEKDYPLKQAEILRKMTKEDVNQQIKKYFDENALTTVVVGDKWIIESQLEKSAKEAANKDVLNKVKLKKISID